MIATIFLTINDLQSCHWRKGLRCVKPDGSGLKIQIEEFDHERASASLDYGLHCG